MNNRRNIAKFKPLVLAGMLAGLAGCSLFRKPQPMQIPSGLEDFPGIFELKTGPKKAEALQKVFPPIKEYIMSGDVLAERRKFFFFRAKSLMRLSLISGGDRKIRMAGRHPGDETTLFDLMADAGVMRVYIPPQGQFYQGQISAKGSPFEINLGVEPWDLAPICAIGRRAIQGSPTWIPDRKAKLFVLTPNNKGPLDDGLERIEIDSNTGLPVRACWRREHAQWEVNYLGWDFFRNGEDDPQAWLMPSHLLILSRKPKVKIEVTVRQYRINPAADPRRWKIAIPSGIVPRSLTELEEGFKGL